MSHKLDCPWCGRPFVNLERHMKLYCRKRPQEGDVEALVKAALEAAGLTGTAGGAKKATKKAAEKKATKKAAKKKATKKAAKKKATKKAAEIVEAETEVPAIDARSEQTKSASKEPRVTTTKPKRKSTKARRNALKKQLLELIADFQPITQSEIVERAFDSSPTEEEMEELNQALSALYFEKKVFRTRVLERGAWMYEFRLSDEKKPLSAKKEWETMGNCPCFVCPDLSKCNTGQNRYNPQYCQHMSQWIACSLEGVEYAHKFYEEEEEEEIEAEK
ncbi:MAG: hypothetical protein Kow0069_18640 [Promethearchaeota archaeon]